MVQSQKIILSLDLTHVGISHTAMLQQKMINWHPGWTNDKNKLYCIAITGGNIGGDEDDDD
jgi:hypothetical protein